MDAREEQSQNILSAGPNNRMCFMFSTSCYGTSDLWEITPPPNSSPTNEDMQNVLQHLTGVMKNSSWGTNEVVVDSGSYRDNRTRQYTNSSLLRYFQEDGGDFFDNSSLGESSSGDFLHLFNNIKRAVKNIFIGNGFYKTEREKLEVERDSNEQYKRIFRYPVDSIVNSSIMFLLNAAEDINMTRSNYLRSITASRIFFYLNSGLAIAGKVLHRPILMKSSVALMAITTIYMSALYYRFSTKEESLVHSLRYGMSHVS